MLLSGGVSECHSTEGRLRQDPLPKLKQKLANISARDFPAGVSRNREVAFLRNTVTQRYAVACDD